MTPFSLQKHTQAENRLGGFASPAPVFRARFFFVTKAENLPRQVIGLEGKPADFMNFCGFYGLTVGLGSI